MKKEKSKIRTCSLRDKEVMYIKSIGDGSFTTGIRNMKKFLELFHKELDQDFEESYISAAMAIKEKKVA